MGLGRHLLADFYGVDADKLDDPPLLTATLALAASRAGLTPIAVPVTHRFEGGGVTGYILLSESHIALHTYPEFGYVAVDVFSCGPADPHAALAAFREALAPKKEDVTAAERGREIPRR